MKPGNLDCCGDLRRDGPGMCDDCPVAAMEKVCEGVRSAAQRCADEEGVALEEWWTDGGRLSAWSPTFYSEECDAFAEWCEAREQ